MMCSTFRLDNSSGSKRILQEDQETDCKTLSEQMKRKEGGKLMDYIYRTEIVKPFGKL